MATHIVVISMKRCGTMIFLERSKQKGDIIMNMSLVKNREGHDTYRSMMQRILGF